MLAGNERRTEHLSRLAGLAIKEEYSRRRWMTPAMLQHAEPRPAGGTILAALDASVMLKYAPWRLTFRYGYTEVVMRAGPPQYTGRTEEGLSIALYPYPRLSFVPKGSAFLNHMSATSEDWSLHDPYAFEFITGWNSPMEELEYQLAYFRRGNSALIVAASDMRSDSALRDLSPLAALFMQKDFDQPALHTEKIVKGIARFSMSAPPESTLASIEVIATNGTSGRVRFATGPQEMPEQRVSLSDVLLIERTPNLPKTLVQAESLSLGRTRVPFASTVGLFWEMYGLANSEAPHMSMVVTHGRNSFLGNLFGGSNREDTLATTIWNEPPVAGNAIESRSIGLDLRSLPGGTYTLSLTMELPGQAPVTSKRTVAVLGWQ
jgi:hypothetical protein